MGLNRIRDVTYSMGNGAKIVHAAILWVALTVSGFAQVTVPVQSGLDLAAMDTSIRPQDDFYQYVNGTWLARTKIPAQFTSYSIYTEAYEQTEQALKRIVEQAAQARDPSDEQRLIADLYRSWMDTAQIEQLGLTPLIPEIRQILAISNHEELVRCMLFLEMRGVMVPFTLYVQPDLKDATRNLLYLHQNGLTLPSRRYYLDNDNTQFAGYRQALGLYVQQMLGFLPDPVWQTRVPAVLGIEQQLASLHIEEMSSRDTDETYHPYALDELAQISPQFPWAGLDVLADYTDRINIDHPRYLQGLASVLHNTPLEDWQAYLLYRLIDSRARHLPAAVDDMHHLLHGTILSGQQQKKTRWRRAVSFISQRMADPLGKLYVAENFPPEAKQRVENMVSQVLTTFEKRLKVLDWMSDETKLAALEKLQRFGTKIGYPTSWRDFSGLTFDPKKHMDNVRQLALFNYQAELRKLKAPVDRTEWFMSPQTVNAYYDPTMNEIVFPAARLQAPFFQLEADDAVNYGAIGAIIGHEISHGFDSQGSRFDANGNLRHWWTDKDKQAFAERADKLIAQYSQFDVLPDLKVNAKLTLNENIGDLAGLRLAYYAYLDSLQGKPAPVLDGFSGEQRFFIGYAMTRRGKLTDSALLAQAVNDPHAPLRYRVNGVVQNIPEFYAAFGVKPGDKHYLAPELRASFW